MAQLVKNLPAMRETWIQSLGWGDPLEEGVATPSGNSCLENPPKTAEPGGLQAMGSQRVRHDLATKPSTIKSVSRNVHQ